MKLYFIAIAYILISNIWQKNVYAEGLFCNGIPLHGPITINCDMSDWLPDMIVGNDDRDIGWDPSRDLNKFYMVNDQTTLYGRFTCYGNVPTDMGSMLSAVTYCFDMDNNQNTGGTVQFNTCTMTGVDVMITMSMGGSNGLWPNNVYKWNQATSIFEYNCPTNAASDGVTGSEWSLSLAQYGNNGSTPIRWICIQRFHGDVYGGNTWNASPAIQTYYIVNQRAPFIIDNFEDPSKTWWQVGNLTIQNQNTQEYYDGTNSLKMTVTGGGNIWSHLVQTLPVALDWNYFTKLAIRMKTTPGEKGPFYLDWVNSDGTRSNGVQGFGTLNVQNLYSNGFPLSERLIIDGDMSDWKNQMFVGTDPAEINWDASRDLKDFYMADDAVNLYGRFTCYGNVPTDMGSMLSAVTYYFDMDNNTNTGGTVQFGSCTMAGVDATVTMSMGGSNGLWPNNVYKWNQTNNNFQYLYPTNAASDGVTGAEWSLNLAQFGITSEAIIRWICVQQYHGDVVPGATWGSQCSPRSYNVTGNKDNGWRTYTYNIKPFNRKDIKEFHVYTNSSYFPQGNHVYFIDRIELLPDSAVVANFEHGNEGNVATFRLYPNGWEPSNDYYLVPHPNNQNPNLSDGFYHLNCAASKSAGQNYSIKKSLAPTDWSAYTGLRLSARNHDISNVIAGQPVYWLPGEDGWPPSGPGVQFYGGFTFSDVENWYSYDYFFEKSFKYNNIGALFFYPYSGFVSHNFDLDNIKIHSEPTVTIDLASTTGSILHRASGFLGGISNSINQTLLVDPLKLKYFRFLTAERLVPNSELMSLLTKNNTEVQIALEWFDVNGTNFPGDPWTKWDNHVNSQLDKALNNNYSWFMWDIWNEADGNYWNESWGWDNFQILWDHTYNLIKSKYNEKSIGTPKIVGPSFSAYRPDLLKPFLLHCKANGTLPTYVTWHEFSLGSQTHDYKGIPAHVQEMQNWMVVNGINPPIPVHINEYGHPETQNPGRTAWYLTMLENSNIAGACRTCWPDNAGDDCNQLTLCGLLTLKPGENFGDKPKSVWWVQKAYSDLAGNLVKVDMPFSATIGGLATVDIPNNSVTVLLGRDGGHGEDIEVRFDNINSLPSNFRSTGNVRIIADKIANSMYSESTGPSNTINGIYPIVNNTVTVFIPFFGESDAYILKLLPPN
jgi:hypothetical protein